MAKKPEPILAIDLGENGGKATFRSVEEIEAWVNKETAFWSWMPGVPQHDVINQAWSRINVALSQIQAHIQNAKNNQQQPNYGGFVDAIRDLMASYYMPSPQVVLHSAAPIAKYIDKLRLSEPIIAAFLVADQMKCIWEPARSQLIRGIVEAVLFENGLRSNLEPEKASLRELREEWRKELRSAVDESTDVQNRFEGTLTQVQTLYDNQKVEHDKIVSDHISAFNLEIDRSKKDLENITRTYEEKLKLQAPVKYWAKKRKGHLLLAIGFGVACLVTMTLAGWYIGSQIHALLANLDPGATPEYWKLGGLFVLATLSVWVIRILVRIFLSHVHLEADAAERMTMVQTYLALVRRGQGPKDEDRQLILQTLFRPAVTGIVKDDAAPVSLIEWFTRAGGKN